MSTIKETQVETIHSVMPEHANPLENLYGGRLMYWITEASYLCASRVARGPVVLGSMDGIDFLSPIYVGDMVSVQAEVEYIGKSSMDLSAKIIAENPNTGKRRITAFSNLAYVAVDLDGKPRPIPNKIEPSSEEEILRYKHAQERRKRRLERLKHRIKQALPRVSSWSPYPYTLEYTRLVFPEDTLAPGVMFSGRLFLDLDQAASILAHRFARGTMVTASFDEIDFYAPIKQGNILIIQLAIVSTGNTSVEINARVMAEDIESGKTKLCCQSYTTFVLIDKDGRPKKLPQKLVPLTEQQLLEFKNAQERKRLRLERAKGYRKLAEKFAQD